MLQVLPLAAAAVATAAIALSTALTAMSRALGGHCHYVCQSANRTSY